MSGDMPNWETRARYLNGALNKIAEAVGLDPEVVTTHQIVTTVQALAGTTPPVTIPRTTHKADRIMRSASTCTRHERQADGTYALVTHEDGAPMLFGINMAWAELEHNPKARLRDHGNGVYRVELPGYYFEFSTHPAIPALTPGARVELAPHTDEWARGDRYGVVVRAQPDGSWTVSLDRSGRRVEVRETEVARVIEAPAADEGYTL